MKQVALEKGSVVDNTLFFTDLPDCNIVPECRDFGRKAKEGFDAGNQH